MWHLAGFYESVNPAGVLTQINAIADQAISTNGVDLTVPTALPNLIFEAGMYAGTGPGYAQVQSPSLRQLANQDVLPIAAAAVFGANPACQPHFGLPRGLKGNESLNFAIEATGGAAADAYGLVGLSDGAISPVSGNIFTVRATAAVALAAGTWVNGALTFDSSFPAGMYEVVGMRAQGTNLVAARLSFVGGAFRPGVPAVNAESDIDARFGRFGSLGSFGVFDSTQPPTVDCLGATDNSQVILLDLRKTS